MFSNLVDSKADIKIYVADLAAYNAGHLHGVWIDATDEPGDMHDIIAKLLKDSPVFDAEEYAIHDHDGFGGCGLSEYESLESVHQKALFIEQYGYLGALVLANCNDDIDQATTDLEDNYHGEYESMADYAQQLTEDCSEIPSYLQGYIDWERMGRDMELCEYYTIEINHREVHVFSS